MLKIKHEWWKYFSVAAALLPTREHYFSSSSQPCYERAKLKKHRAKVCPAFTTVGQQTANCSQTSWPCIRWASIIFNLIWKQTKTGKRRMSLCLTSQNCHSFSLWRWCLSAPMGHCWESLHFCRWFFRCSLADRKSGSSKNPSFIPRADEFMFSPWICHWVPTWSGVMLPPHQQGALLQFTFPYMMFPLLGIKILF